MANTRDCILCGIALAFSFLIALMISDAIFEIIYMKSNNDYYLNEIKRRSKTQDNVIEYPFKHDEIEKSEG